MLRNYCRTGDGADTKGKVPSDHPDRESGASSSGEEGDHDSAAYATSPSFDLGCN